MGEMQADNAYHAAPFLTPLEQGVVTKFDRLFTRRQKGLKKWLADSITNKQEFLTRTFPNLITIGAEHPQLSGGVLYMMGLISREVPDGSQAVNSIARRFAERKATRKAKYVRTVLTGIHAHNETILKQDPAKTPDAPKEIRMFTTPEPNITPKERIIINKELERTRLTRELFDVTKHMVPVRYKKDNAVVDLGENAGLVSMLNKDSKTGHTMVFLCTSGGDPQGAESFVVAYAQQTGDRVIILGMPDAPGGTMTDAFARAVIDDAKPPALDTKQQFSPPTYTPHTEFFRQMITNVIPDRQFDLYSHSGSGLVAKNLLHDPDISNRVQNAVFLNPAGVSNISTRVPSLFRTIPAIKQTLRSLSEFPRFIRSTYDRDLREKAKTPEYIFRDTVTRAVQDGSHYRQPGWDSMKVSGKGKIVLYLGKHDALTGGKDFARFMEQRLNDTTIERSKTYVDLDPQGHHATPFTRPEEVISALFVRYFPDRRLQQ